jgi:hypothetical protein
MSHSHRLFQQWCDAAHRLAVDDRPAPANRTSKTLQKGIGFAQATPPPVGKWIRGFCGFDGGHAQHVVLRIEHHDPQLLAFQAAHLEDQAVGDVVRAADRPACGRPVREESAPKLEGRLELRRLGVADAVDRLELKARGPRKPSEPVESRQGLRCEIDRGSPRSAGAPDDRDQLGRR